MTFQEFYKEDKLDEFDVVENWSEFLNSFGNNRNITGKRLDQQKKKLFNTAVNLQSLKGKIVFSNCIFREPVSLYDLDCRELVFNDCIFMHVLQTSVTTKVSGNFIINDAVVRHVDFFGGEYGFCIWSFRFAEYIKVHHSVFKQFQIFCGESDRIETLVFNASMLKGEMSIEGISKKKTIPVIKKLSLSGVLADTSLSISNIGICLLDIYDFSNQKFLKLTNLSPINVEGFKPRFFISQSNLSSAEITDLDFSKFEIISVIHSQIHNVVFTSIKWIEKFSSIKLMARPSNDNSLNDTQNYLDYLLTLTLTSDNRSAYRLREVYRQLKYSNSKQGDFIYEQEFHGKEMLEYKKTLKGYKHIWTRLIIAASSCLSNFGQSISKPFFGLLVGHFIFFSLGLATNSFNEVVINLCNPTLDGFNEGMHQYLRLINPIHSIDNDFKGPRIIIDVIMRIWSSYMIYNFVRASRRFIK